MDKSIIESYPRYESYKDSSVDWLGDIPKDWEVLPIKALGEIKSVVGNENEELLSVYLNRGVIRFDDVDEKRTNATSLSLEKYQLVEEGDFVLNNQQAWRGSVGVSSYRGIVSPAYLVLNLTSKLDANYANYMFRDIHMVSQYLISSKGVGTIQRNLYWNSFKNCSSAIPPLNTQLLITKFLEQKVTKIDQAISLKQQQIKKLEEYKQIVIQNAVTKGLNPDVSMKNSGVDWIGKIPEHWESKRLMFVADSYNKKILSSKSDLAYLGMESIESRSGKLSSESSEAEGLASHFRKGQILFGKLRPYLAKVYLTEFEGLCSTEFMVLDVGPEILKEFLKFQLLSSRFIDQINSSTYGSKMPRANSEYIKRQFVAIPPLDEQRRIVNKIEAVTNLVESTILSNEAQINRLKEYKIVLINEAVTGKIKVV